MARRTRELSKSGMYHIIFRGINKQNIFQNNNDFLKMYETITMLKQEMNFELYAYCFLSNHVHLLLKENEMGDISQIMKRLLTKYVMWFNFKYERSGNLVANRYKSKPVEDDEYFLSLIRYIHQNPIKAGLVSSPIDYEWSSYSEYVSNVKGITDKEFLFSMMDKHEFVEFHSQISDDEFSISDGSRPDDNEVRRKITMRYNVEPTKILQMSKTERNKILAELKNEFPVRQLERVTGVSRGIIANL